MQQFLHFFHSADWNAVSTVTIAVASLVVAIVSLVIARRSLEIMQETMKQQSRDWCQRKWFDLYFKADSASNLLDRFQTVHSAAVSMNPEKRIDDYNELMLAFRAVISFAMVFPKNEVIDKLSKAMKFGSMSETQSPKRRANVSDAVEGLRLNSLLDSAVLSCTPTLYSTHPESAKLH